VIMPTASSGTFYISNQNDNDILAVKVTGLNTNDLYATVGSNLDEIDPATGTVTPVVTGLNAAHGLLFEPSTSGTPDLTALLKTISQDLYQAFANLGLSAQGAGSSGSGGMTPDPAISATAIASLLNGGTSNALAGLFPTA